MTPNLQDLTQALMRRHQLPAALGRELARALEHALIILCQVRADSFEFADNAWRDQPPRKLGSTRAVTKLALTNLCEFPGVEARLQAAQVAATKFETDDAGNVESSGAPWVSVAPSDVHKLPPSQVSEAMQAARRVNGRALNGKATGPQRTKKRRAVGDDRRDTAGCPRPGVWEACQPLIVFRTRAGLSTAVTTYNGSPSLALRFYSEALDAMLMSVGEPSAPPTSYLEKRFKQRRAQSVR